MLLATGWSLRTGKRQHGEPILSTFERGDGRPVLTNSLTNRCAD